MEEPPLSKIFLFFVILLGIFLGGWGYVVLIPPPPRTSTQPPPSPVIQAVTPTPLPLATPSLQIEANQEAFQGPPFITFASGHSDQCGQENEDILYAGTEVFNFTTCVFGYQNIQSIRLFANKPTSYQIDPLRPLSLWNIYETSLSPTINPNHHFYAQVELSGEGIYYGLAHAPAGQTENTRTEGYTPTEGAYIYVNRSGATSSDFRPGEAVARWRVVEISHEAAYARLYWEMQILDVQYLWDDLQYEHIGVEKNLDLYYQINTTAWVGPVAKLIRRGDFVFTGIEHGKDHTILKLEDKKYYLLSMWGDLPPLTYQQYTFQLTTTATKTLVLDQFQEAPGFLNPAFNLLDSDDFCRLSAPYLFKQADSYWFYFTLFGKPRTNECRTHGKQEIYLSTASQMPALTLEGASTVIENGRDPFVHNEQIFYTDALKPKIQMQNLFTGEKQTIFNAEEHWAETPANYWPESPNLVTFNGQQYLFFTFGTTSYLQWINEQWQYQGALSLPRIREWNPNGNPSEQRVHNRFYSHHWAAEFWVDSLGDPTEQYLLSSFMALHCQSVESCQIYSIYIGFVNFDLYGHPYLAVMPITPPKLD
ncbi:MAG: hypothetical protein HUU38_03005 [Anaerolineales bacterium]|nr:hypothetical protein [Anaerolineales bacterium]